MAYVQFTSGSTTLTFTRNPRFPIPTSAATIPIATLITAGGKTYASQKGSSVREWRLQWDFLPEGSDSPSLVDYLGLVAFYSAVSGALNSFTFQDWDGNTYTVRMLSDLSSWREVAEGYWSGEITLREEV